MAEGRGGTHRSKARAEGLRTEVGQCAEEEEEEEGAGEDTSPLHIEALGVEDLRLLLTGTVGSPPDQVPALTNVTPGCSEL